MPSSCAAPLYSNSQPTPVSALLAVPWRNLSSSHKGGKLSQPYLLFSGQLVSRTSELPWTSVALQSPPPKRFFDIHLSHLTCLSGRRTGRPQDRIVCSCATRTRPASALGGMSLGPADAAGGSAERCRGAETGGAAAAHPAHREARRPPPAGRWDDGGAAARGESRARPSRAGCLPGRGGLPASQGRGAGRGAACQSRQGGGGGCLAVKAGGRGGCLPVGVGIDELQQLPPPHTHSTPPRPSHGQQRPARRLACATVGRRRDLRTSCARDP